MISSAYTRPPPFLPFIVSKLSIIQVTSYPLLKFSKQLPSTGLYRKQVKFKTKPIMLLLLLLLSHFSRVQFCATPQMAAHQAPPSLGFSRQEHWSGLPFPSPMYESEKESEVTQSCSCPTLHDPMDCSPPGSSVHGIFQARVLEWGAIAFSASEV